MNTEITYPAYFKNFDGKEQIKLKGPNQQIYVRAVVQENGNCDYCYMKGYASEQFEEILRRQYQVSTETEYLQLLKLAADFFTKIGGQLLGLPLFDESLNQSQTVQNQS